MDRPARTGMADLAIVLGFGLLMVASLLVVSAVSGLFAASSMDADSAMRLVEIQDYLAGQNWFDVSQARLGPDGGTAMHWSRLVDLPVLAITSLLDVFLPSDAALHWATVVWPPISVLLLVWALVSGARFLGGRETLVFTCIIAATILFRHQNFLSGSIDHHNLQLGFLALSLAFSIDPQRRPTSLAVAGAALASSVAIGAEVYPFVAVICAFHALDWALAGRAAQRGAVAFGVSLAAMTAVFFAASVAPANYGAVYCDALSLVTVSAALLGGVGLALAAVSLSGRSLPWRLTGLGMIGLGCGLLLALQAPQCLANPLDGLPSIVRTLWLEKVDEARPLFAARPSAWQEIPFMIGISLVAATVSLFQIELGINRRAHVLFLLLLVLDIVLTLQQVRFYSFGHIFAILPLGAWVAGLFTGRPDGGERGVGYLLALAVSVPLVWGAPGLFLKSASGSSPAVADVACASPDMLSVLNAQPEGLVLAVADAAPDILRYTGQRALHGHYHRNAAGIEMALRIFISPPDEAAALMRADGVAYVLACPSQGEFQMLAKAHPDGLAARLVAGDALDFLTPVAGKAGGEMLYVVTR
ncbi:hypothetical protein [Hyphomonas sp.]|uniref:hypothetical protein n=1 Tax=Hyphomonas sp. TaxID=87 RepID=UPI0030F7BCD3